ncbi:MAG: hypothetical protein IT406_03410 [Candidatus Yanofskybacteria bacterium]|nr:hypothetical protein [Candidatus Yanofskybacteria bacterium]
MLKDNKLYSDELAYVKSKGALLRNVVVLSAMIEAHITSLADSFLIAHKVKYKPRTEWDEYGFAIRIIEGNSLLSKEELKSIYDFRKIRKLIFHNLFKSELSRSDFNSLIKQAYSIGLKVVEALEGKEL